MARKWIRYREMKERGYFNNRPACNRAIAAGYIPAPVELGENTLAWDVDELAEFDAKRPRRHPKSSYTPSVKAEAV